MKILLTGSSGQLGAEIARQLSSDHRITGVDLAADEFTSHLGNVTNRKLMFELVEGIDAIIHTASLHAPHVGQFPKEQFIEVNLKGTLHLLEAAVTHKVKRFIYTSTTSLYGFAMVPQQKAVWVTEELVPQPRDIYDITKLAAEQLCKNIALEHGLPCICLRTSRFWDETPAMKAIYRLYRGLDVRDAAAAHCLALRKNDVKFEIFNISAQSPFAESDCEELLHDARSVIRRYHPSAEKTFGQRGWEMPESIDRVYVIAKAKKMLGYRPQHNFEQLIN